MRIIAGELKGRRLQTPLDNKIRPTADKVKEAIFSMAASRLPDSVVVDLFAGTGNLGLEAISRGARCAYFVDRDRRSIALVRDNIRHCGVEDRTVIICADYASALNRLTEKADLFFLDPPYSGGYMEDVLTRIEEGDLLSDDGWIIAEHGIKEELPEMIGHLQRIKVRKYGKIGISVFEKQEGLSLL